MAGEILAQLPEDLKSNEAFTGFNTAEDFAKALLTEKGKVTEFDGKVKGLDGEITNLKNQLANSIPRLGENPTDVERAAFYKAFGLPEKATDYEFPKTEGIDNDPETMAWAQGVFHKAGLNKDQAMIISKEWNEFIRGVIKDQEEADTKAEADRKAADEKAMADAETKLKAEWGVDYDKNIEFVRRGFPKFADKEFDEFVRIVQSDKQPLGNSTIFLRFLHKVAKAMGEDWSPPSSISSTPTKTTGIEYNMPDFE